MIITNILLKVCVSVSQVHLDLCLWTIFPEFFWYVTLKQNVIWILGLTSSPFLHSHLCWILMTWMECTSLLLDFELGNISCFDYQNEVEVLVLSIEVWSKYALAISMVQGEWETHGADLVLYVKQNHPNWSIEPWKQVLIVVCH